MSDLFCDRLMDAIDAVGSPICVGIDPMPESFPASLRAKYPTMDHEPRAAVDGVFEFVTGVLKVVAGLVPIVKFQSAYFEQFRAEGVEAYFSLMQEAKDLGLLVIGDVKRGDIGSTAAAYAAGHLEEFSESDEGMASPDAITVNPMLGMDTLAPFVKTAKELDKGLFVLVRTSNPGAGELQDAKLQSGETWSEMLADRVNKVAMEPGLVGRRGHSSIGAVVGATAAHTMRSLRGRLPKSIFLLPGYGAQGATAEMTRAAFVGGQGAIVSASRSILYAHADKKYAGISGDWEKCVREAVGDMRTDLARMLKEN